MADIATVLPAPRLDRVLCMDDSFPDFSARLLHQEKWHEVLLSSSLNLFIFAKLGQVYRWLNISLGTTSIMGRRVSWLVTIRRWFYGFPRVEQLAFHCCGFCNELVPNFVRLLFKSRTAGCRRRPIVPTAFRDCGNEILLKSGSRMLVLKTLSRCALGLPASSAPPPRSYQSSGGRLLRPSTGVPPFPRVVVPRRSPTLKHQVLHTLQKVSEERATTHPTPVDLDPVPLPTSGAHLLVP